MATRTQTYTYGNHEDDRLLLSDGSQFGPVTLAYETYGQLNADKSNAILLFHASPVHSMRLALIRGGRGCATMDNGMPDRLVDAFIGPGKILDTDHYFIICCNYFGGCYGSTGPSSINPETQTPYGGSFLKFTLPISWMPNYRFLLS